MKTPLETIEALIRRAALAEARTALLSISFADIPRAQLPEFARLCWRCGLAELGVRALFPLIRTEGRKSRGEASAAETAEYAGCLIRLGALAEAESLLKQLSSDYPRAAFYRAAVGVARWDYDGSLPLLRAYVDEPSLSDYERAVVNLNIAAALVFLGRGQEARTALLATMATTARESLPFAESQRSVIEAKLAITEGELSAADRALTAASLRLAGLGTVEEAVWLKFRGVVRFLHDPANPAGIAALREARALAEQVGHWETMRDCDRFEAIGRQDVTLLARVYFGTPFPSYRKHLNLDGDWRPAFPPSYLYTPSGKPAGETIDLRTGKVEPKGRTLPVGRANYRLLRAMASDFYQPLSIATVHEAVYPGEYFNPESAPVRVRQAAKRLRRWLAENHLELEIIGSPAGYRLGGTAGIRLHRDAEKADRSMLLVDKLRTAFAASHFSVSEASAVLRCSRSSALRTLNAAVAEGRLGRTGTGSSTLYQVIGALALPRAG